MNPNSEQNPDNSLQVGDYLQVLQHRWREILLTFVLVVITSTAVVALLPRKYDSLAEIRVQPPGATMLVSPDQGPDSTTNRFMSPNWMGTQPDVMMSEETLRIVNAKLDLQSKWGMDKDEVIARLTSMINAENPRGKDKIEITVRHTDPDEAQQINFAIIKAYEQRRIEEEQVQIQDALRALGETVQTQEDDVQAKIRVLNNFIDVEKYKVSWDTTGYGAMNPTRDFEEEEYRRAVEQRDRLDSEYRQLLSQIQTMEKFEDDAVINYAMGADMPDSNVKRLYPQFQEAERSLQQAKVSGLGMKHPKVVSLERSVTELHKQLEEAVVQLRETMSNRLSMVKQTLEAEKKAVSEKNLKLERKVKLDQQYVKAKNEYDTAKKTLESLLSQQRAETARLKQPRKPLQYDKEPSRSAQPASPNVPLLLGAAAFVGLAFGVAIAFFLEFMDTSVKTMEDVERFLQVPVLGVIPSDVGVLHQLNGISPDAEAYRILRTNIEFNRKSSDFNAITFVSGGAGEGKSTTLCNLAYVCAQGGYTTLMIDADLRRPQLHKFFDMDNTLGGLSGYLTSEMQLEDVVVQTQFDNLFFMPSGLMPSDAAGILNSRRMSELIQECKQRFDLVLVDSPPILGVSDASVIVSEVDLTVIVVQHRKLPKQLLLRVKQMIEMVGGRLLGVVLNNVNVRSDMQYQYYTSYYSYYSTKESRIESNSRKGSSAGGNSTSVAKNDKSEPVSTSSESGDDLY